MGDIIPFPIKGRDAKAKTLEWVAATYRKAGLRESVIPAAVAEFASSWDAHMGEPRFVAVGIPECGLTEEQQAAVNAAMDDCMRQVREQATQAMAMALCEIAGHIGAKYNS